MGIVRIDYRFYDDIVKYAREHLPEEACGLIAGEDTPEGKTVKKVYFLTNVDHADDHFTLDPKEQLDAVKDMRANGLKPLGNWHSHPESPSRPSDEDIRLSYDKNASYFILSLMAENPVLNSFHVEDRKVTKEDLRIISEKYYY
jgi:proteasome lid subunit RPN8/RPN11